MVWWLWVVLGLGGVLFEIFLPLNFFVIFIGLGFITTGALVAIDVLPMEWMQWLSAGMFTILYYVSFHKQLAGLLKSAPDRKEDYVGEFVLVQSEIPVGETGKGELRGTGWQVRNDSDQPLQAGKKCRISGVDGVTLIVRNQFQ